MSTLRLQKLVGQAVISDDFRAGLMNERRAELLRLANLEPDELAAITAIRAANFAEFSAAVEALIEAREQAQSAPYHVEPHWPRVINWERAESELHA